MRMNIDRILPGDRVLCAVSGGADSMYLLARMLELAPERGFTVLCAHYNHGLRGAESDRDESFVRDFCLVHNVPCFVGRLDSSVDSEAQLRAARYAFLQRIAGEQNIQWILTAHTADDQLETMLLNLARGTGLRGLAGIPEIRKNVLRPMLLISRTEVDAWLNAHGIPHVEDSTNDSDRYARNRIRQQVIPALRSVNAAAVEHAAETAEHLREEEEFLMSLADAYLIDNSPENGLTLASLQVLARPIRMRVFQKLCGGNLSARHIAALHDLCFGTEAAFLDLPGIRVRREQGRMYFGSAEAEPLPELELHPGLQLLLSQHGYRLSVDLPTTYDEIHNTLTVYHFKTEWIRGKLTFTSRRPGDQIRLAGRGCTKKISDLMAEGGIPVSQRDRIPVLRDALGPVAVFGFGLAERCAANPGDLALRVSIETLTPSETEKEKDEHSR